MDELLFQWTFQVLDYKNFEGTSIVVSAPTYKDALRKIRNLKLPHLSTFEDVEDGVKLLQVYELDYLITDADDARIIETKDDDE